MDELKRLVQHIAQFYDDTGSDLDAECVGYRCKVCGHEMAHQAGDAKRYLMNGWPRHCEQTMHLITRTENEQE